MSTLYLYQCGPNEALRLTLAAPPGTSYATPPAVTLWITAPSGQVFEVGPDRWTVVTASAASVVVEGELDGTEVLELARYRLDVAAVASGGTVIRYLPFYLQSVDVRRTEA